MKHEEEQVVTAVRALLKKEGAWGKVAAVILGIPMVVGAVASVATYIIVGLTWIHQINYAKNSAPVLYSAITEVRDSLNSLERDKFHFRALMMPPK